MVGHSLTKIFVTRQVLIEELRNFEFLLSECIVQQNGSNSYIQSDWNKLQSLDNTWTICACYEGIGALIPFEPGVSPYTLGCIFCDDPEQFDGYLAEAHFSWCGDRGLPEDLSPQVEKAFFDLKRRLRRRCKSFTWHTTESDRSWKVYVSTCAIAALRTGKKFCQTCGPGRIEPGVFYIESGSEKIVIY